MPHYIHNISCQNCRNGECNIAFIPASSWRWYAYMANSGARPKIKQNCAGYSTFNNASNNYAHCSCFLHSRLRQKMKILWKNRYVCSLMCKSNDLFCILCLCHKTWYLFSCTIYRYRYQCNEFIKRPLYCIQKAHISFDVTFSVSKASINP